jgi:hypothetical protein
LPEIGAVSLILAAWQALSEEARAQTRAKSGQWITSLCWLERLEQIATVLEQNKSN